MQVFFLMLVLGSGSALAQSIPDFSGVFLRERVEDHGVATVSTEAQNPLVLDIKQGTDTLRVTEIQHGVQATDTYDLGGKATMNASPDGVRSKDQVKFYNGKLVLKSEWTDPYHARTDLVTEQTWELSSDLQTLTIQPKIEPRGRLPRDFRRIAVFARQASLRVALEKAQAASAMNNCMIAPHPSGWVPRVDLSRGVVFGYTSFEELLWDADFEAHLRGDFFSGLRRAEAFEEAGFRKNGQVIQTYDGSLALEVIPFMKPHPRYLFSTMGAVMGWGDPHLPEWLLNLRFRIEWVGSESRDLGEVPAKLGHQPWPDDSHPRKIYQIAVPARGVPLTDSLEIHILSAAGTQLGCISGRI